MYAAASPSRTQKLLLEIKRKNMSASNSPEAVERAHGTVLRLPVSDWSSFKDQTVEIHVQGKVTDSGYVDDVMADGSVLWLKGDGASGRGIIENLPDTDAHLVQRLS